MSKNRAQPPPSGVGSINLKIADDVKHRAQMWRDAADRAEIREEHVAAIFFRNLAWEIEHGNTWLGSQKAQ